MKKNLRHVNVTAPTKLNLYEKKVYKKLGFKRFLRLSLSKKSIKKKLIMNKFIETQYEAAKKEFRTAGSELTFATRQHDSAKKAREAEATMFWSKKVKEAGAKFDAMYEYIVHMEKLLNKA